MSFVRKAITITKEQNEWIENNCINLSRLVQKIIDKRIKKHDKK